MSKKKIDKKKDKTVRSINNNIRSSVRKLNPILRGIVGKKVDIAIRDLQFSEKRITKDIRKTINSAVANAENNFQYDIDKLIVKEAFYGKRYLGADISSPPFDKVAELYGAKGFKVKKVSEINQAVREALKINKPVVIDVDVDPKALYSFRRDSFKHRSKK